MNQPKVRIYVGKIEEWTGDISDCQKKAESICGRRLLAYGLKDMGVEGIFPLHCKADEVYEILERQIEKGVHGKPYLRISRIFILISVTQENMRRVRFLLFPADLIYRKSAPYGQRRL